MEAAAGPLGGAVAWLDGGARCKGAPANAKGAPAPMAIGRIIKLATTVLRATPRRLNMGVVSSLRYKVLKARVSNALLSSLRRPLKNW